MSFGGKQFHCLIPWEAIFGITHNASGDGQVWPEDLPVEVMQTMAERDRKPAPQHQPEPARMRPALSAVPDEDDASTQPEPPKAPGSKRHLRLVR